MHCVKFTLKRDQHDHRDFVKASKAHALYPSEVDLRSRCPAVYSQGGLGSCAAMATAAQYAFNQRDFDPSRLFVYYNARAETDTTDLDIGASLRDTLKAFASIGACSEKTWPYIEEKYAQKPSEDAYREASSHRVKTYYRIPMTVHELKTEISNMSPVCVGIEAVNSFLEIGPDGIVPPPQSDEQSIGGHAVLLVGYNATHFLIRNSWGKEWGEDGYGYLPISYLYNDLMWDGWAITK